MNTVLASLAELYKRDLDRLLKELKSYEDQDMLWSVRDDVLNSGGNLVLHICGNLRHFIGAILGGTSYIRKRDDEFELKGVKKSDLILQIKETKKTVAETLAELDEEKLLEIYPINVLGKEMTTLFFLQHLYGHLNYHLGQLNYHRRLLDK